MIERWNWEDSEHREQFRGEPFATVDPGTAGYVLGFTGVESEVPTVYCHALEPVSMADLLVDLRCRVLVTESQFIGNPSLAKSVLDLSFRHGISLGYCAAYRCHLAGDWDERLHLFEVVPSTWQAFQRAGRKKVKGDGIAHALERAGTLLANHTEWQKANTKQREGMASALGIADWWRSLW